MNVPNLPTEITDPLDAFEKADCVVDRFDPSRRDPQLLNLEDRRRLKMWRDLRRDALNMMGDLQCGVD